MTHKEDVTAETTAGKRKAKVLMAVFNPIEFDGRVKRAAETLNKDFEVILFCPASLNTTKRDLSEKITIKRALLPWKKWPNTLSLAVFWLQFIRLAVAARPEIIYSHDYYLPFPGFIAAKLLRALSVYDAHELIIPNQTGRMSMRNRVYYWLEKISVRHHDLVIAANSERAELMKQHYLLSTLPTAIRNVSKPTLGSVRLATIIEKYPDLQRDNNEQFVVYMGDVALTRGLGTVIEAFDYLHENISLIVVGDGPDRLMLQKNQSNKSGEKKRVRLLGAIPQPWIQDVLSLCDVGVLVYSMEGLNNYYCSPNKIFEYAQAGLPVVTTAQPPLVTMVNKYNIGKVVGVNGQCVSSKNFADAIFEVLRERAGMILNIPKFLAENSLGGEQDQLRKAIQSMFMKRVDGK